MLSELQLTSSQRIILERTAAEFEASGQWVDFDTLADEAAQRDDSSFNLDDVFSLPRGLGGAWSQEQVSLTGLGLLVAGTAPACARLMARITEIGVERRLALGRDAKLSRGLLVAEYGFTPEEAQRSGPLATMVPGLTGGGTADDDWSLTVFRGALVYRKVHTVEDLRAVMLRDVKERQEQYLQALATGPIANWAGPSGPDPTDALVFLSWGGDVSGRVATVMQQVLTPRIPQVQVFLSTTSIDPGDDPLRAMLEDGLLKAQVLVAVLTAQASQRPWVIWETASAWARQQLVIPIFVDIQPSDVPGPLAAKVQGVHLASRSEMDRALAVIAQYFGADSVAALTQDEYDELLTAAAEN